MIDEQVREEPRSRAVLPWVLTIGLLMFAIGMLLSPWFEENVRSQLPGELNQPGVRAVAARIERQSGAFKQLEARVAALEARPGPSPLADSAAPALNDPALLADARGQPDSGAAAELNARIAALDRVSAQTGTRVDNLSAEVASLHVKIDTVGNNAASSIASAATSAQKARGVLLVTAARRAAEQGQSLAVLEPALRRQFGNENGEAVDKLLGASRGVATLDTLRQAFARLRPTLATSARPIGNGWWQRFKSGVAEIVQVRRTDLSQARNANAARLAEMSARLKRGDVAGALLILHRLPAATQRAAREWRLDAEAYATTFGALQQLEAAVLLEDADLPMSAEPASAAETL